MILFRVFRFFGSEDSIWSEITNPFLDSPKQTHPYIKVTFKSWPLQSKIRAQLQLFRLKSKARFHRAYSIYLSHAFFQLFKILFQVLSFLQNFKTMATNVVENSVHGEIQIRESDLHVEGSSKIVR